VKCRIFELRRLRGFEVSSTDGGCFGRQDLLQMREPKFKDSKGSLKWRQTLLGPSRLAVPCVTATPRRPLTVSAYRFCLWRQDGSSIVLAGHDAYWARCKSGLNAHSDAAPMDLGLRPFSLSGAYTAAELKRDVFWRRWRWAARR